jgi:hypothetical protein
MAISIDYGNTNVIYVPKADLTLVSGTLYDFDTDAFHLFLRDTEDDEIGQAFPTTHTYVASDTIAGVTDFPKVIIRAPYSVEFEAGAYSVRLVGSNNNIFDVDAGILVQNSTQVIPGNSFGNTVTAIGSGVTPQDMIDIAALILNSNIEGGETLTQTLRLLRAESAGKVAVVGNTVTFRDAADSKDRIVATVDENGQRISVTADGT